MKSCRNCKNAIHDGYYWVQLICRFNRRVVVPFSKCLDENKASDTHAQATAKRCKAYEPEETT